MTATFSDSKDESEEETTNNAFSGTLETRSDASFKSFTDTKGSDDDEDLLYTSEYTNEVREQEEIIKKLIQENKELSSLSNESREEYNFLKSKLTSITESAGYLDYESDSEDESLETGKIAEDMIGLGFDHLSKRAKSAPEKVTPPLKKPEDQMSSHMPQHPAQNEDKITDYMSQHYV
jgi:hypothetical protein